MRIVGDIVPVWRAQLSHGNHTDFRNAVEGPNRHSWASAYGPIHQERERSALRPGGQLRTISSLWRYTAYSSQQDSAPTPPV